MQSWVKYYLEVIVNVGFNLFEVLVVFCMRAAQISVRHVNKPRYKRSVLK